MRGIETRELAHWFVSLIVKKKETDAFSAVSQLSIKYSASDLDPTRLKIWCSQHELFHAKLVL